jgi:hypothetical protein
MRLFLVSIPGQHSKTNTMIRVSNFVQVDAITIRKEDLKSQEFSLSVSSIRIQNGEDHPLVTVWQISSASIPLKLKLHVKLQRLSELKIRKAGFLVPSSKSIPVLHIPSILLDHLLRYRWIGCVASAMVHLNQRAKSSLLVVARRWRKQRGTLQQRKVPFV